MDRFFAILSEGVHRFEGNLAFYSVIRSWHQPKTIDDCIELLETIAEEVVNGSRDLNDAASMPRDVKLQAELLAGVPLKEARLRIKPKAHGADYVGPVFGTAARDLPDL
jgi:hypothetical protein